MIVPLIVPLISRHQDLSGVCSGFCVYLYARIYVELVLVNKLKVADSLQYCIGRYIVVPTMTVLVLVFSITHPQGILGKYDPEYNPVGCSMYSTYRRVCY
jgi:hypothetical protein